jgi:hypothetical protein
MNFVRGRWPRAVGAAGAEPDAAALDRDRIASMADEGGVSAARADAERPRPVSAARCCGLPAWGYAVAAAGAIVGLGVVLLARRR